ncbi:nuclear transport factor 2 family protein [Pseudonocardia xishanensis]|uniref:SnoaL-like domain-containing protein n=1 Tax=Pseudonocardia xishanensis TaxID=630995 RepID=A0ABP8RQI9_9PSEU
MDDPRLQQIVDEHEIAKLIVRIAQLADTGDLAEYGRCFTDDAEWHLPAASAVGLPQQARRGLSDILSGAQERRDAGIQGPGTHTHHVPTTTMVDVTGDRASSRSYFRYYVGLDAEPRLVTMGEYHDEFARTPDGWRLRRREIVHP